MIVLVTGGAGFIGSHLCEALLNQDHKVICTDNFLTSTKDNIRHLLKKKNFELIEGDVTDKSSVIRHPSSDITHIFHLASPASPVDYAKYPVETMLVNSIGTYNMLELAKKHRAKFLLASTSEIYGSPKQHPQKEEYWGNVNPVGPRSPYDESKRFAEALILTYLRKFNLEIVIARIFNTYGPRMRKEDGRAIPNFITQALKNEPLTIYGDGTQTRSFCYINDMVEGLLKTIFSATAGEIINLGNPKEVSVLALAQQIREMCGSQSEVTFLPRPEDDPFKRRPDITKAKRILDWEPKTDLEEGLKRTITWFQRSLQREKVL